MPTPEDRLQETLAAALADPDYTVCPSSNYILFHFQDREIIRLQQDGSIFVNGRLAATDLDVVNGMRVILAQAGLGLPVWEETIPEVKAALPPTRFERIGGD